MKTGERIKIISSVLLIICLLLPISSCNRYVDSDGKRFVNYDSKNHPDVKRITTYNYPLDKFNPKDIYSWLLLFSFIWPIPILLYRYKGTRDLVKNILWGIEPLFVLGSSWYIYLNASVFATPFIGAYLSILANCAYAIAWLSELLTKIKLSKTIKTLSLTPPH